MTKEQEEALLDNPQPSKGYAPKPETRELADEEILRKNDSLKDEFGMCSLAYLWAGITVAEFKARHPKGKCLRSETRGRKPLPAEKRRVQRTVSLGFEDDSQLVKVAKERGQSVPQAIESIVGVYLSEIFTTHP